MTHPARPVTVAELAERLGVHPAAPPGGRRHGVRGNSTVSRVVGSAAAGVALSGGVAVAFAPAAAAQSSESEHAQIIEAIQGAAHHFGIGADEVQRVADQFGIAPAEVQQYAGGLGFSSLAPSNSSVLGSNNSDAHTPTTGAITSDFGPRWGAFHNGTDFGAPIGTPLYAAKSGVVEAAGPAAGYGLWIRIRTDDGELLEYGHNDQNYVTVGERVSAGQTIGTVGNRGDSTGPHLHFGVQNAVGQWVDPMLWLATHGVVV